MLHLHLLQDNLNYNSGLVQYRKINPVQLVAYKLLLGLNQFKLVGHNLKQETDLHHLLLSAMEYHNNSKVNPDQYFNKGQALHNKGQAHPVHLLPLHQGLDNLKQDHHQVLQSDLHSKDFNKDPSSLEQPGHQDLQPDLVHLQQVFQYSIQLLSEVHDSKYCENCLKHTQGTLKRLLYSFYYYIYALRLWMCINENMLLVVLAIILFMLSKTHQTSCKPTPLQPFQTEKPYKTSNLIVPNP